MKLTRAERLLLPRQLYILAKNEYIHKQNINVCYVDLSRSIYELQVNFYWGDNEKKGKNVRIHNN